MQPELQAELQSELSPAHEREPQSANLSLPYNSAYNSACNSACGARVRFLPAAATPSLGGPRAGPRARAAKVESADKKKSGVEIPRIWVGSSRDEARDGHSGPLGSARGRRSVLRSPVPYLHPSALPMPYQCLTSALPSALLREPYEFTRRALPIHKRVLLLRQGRRVDLEDRTRPACKFIGFAR